MSCLDELPYYASIPAQDYYEFRDSQDGWPVVERRSLRSLSVTHAMIDARLVTALFERESRVYDPRVKPMIFADVEGKYMVTQMLPLDRIVDFKNCSDPI